MSDSEIWGRSLNTNSFARATAPPSAACFDAIFLQVGVIGVTRPRVKIGLGVIVRALVLVLDKQTDRRAQCHPALRPRLEMHEILFIPLEIDRYTLGVLIA